MLTALFPVSLFDALSASAARNERNRSEELRYAVRQYLEGSNPNGQ
jgi:hypothetical protein